MKTFIAVAAVITIGLSLAASAQDSAPGTSVQTGAAASNSASGNGMAMSDHAAVSSDSMMMKKPAKKKMAKKTGSMTNGMSGGSTANDAGASPNAAGVNGGNDTAAKP